LRRYDNSPHFVVFPSRDLRRVVLYPIDFNQLGEAEAALRAGEKDVRIVGFKITLNGIGALIWEMCDGSHTVGDIIDKIVERFEVNPERVAQDVRQFFGRLEPYSVLEIDWSPL
jgi:hypothetical protein